jgi:CHAT domain-containing protein
MRQSNSQALQIVEEKDRPRVTWCLTGSTTFLPIHAAGVYEGSDLANATQYVVSSYTPSLSVILKARDHWTPIPRQELRALLVAESAAPGLPVLDGVHEEVQAVADILTSVSATVVRDSPKVGVTLRHLPATHLLHLASHGQQREDPLTSCFALQDGGLTIKALMDVRLQNPTLAFLSACETAKGAVEHPDEAVHLAASMMFCGFRSVIATMW